MLTCKQVSKLVSDSLDRELPMHTRMSIRFHLMMCSLCRTYRKQMLQLREIVQAYSNAQEEGEPADRLPQESAEKIKKALAEESQ